jgi:hypothetical protein
MCESNSRSSGMRLFAEHHCITCVRPTFCQTNHHPTNDRYRLGSSRRRGRAGKTEGCVSGLGMLRPSRQRRCCARGCRSTGGRSYASTAARLRRCFGEQDCCAVSWSVQKTPNPPFGPTRLGRVELPFCVVRATPVEFLLWNRPFDFTARTRTT